MTTPESIAEGYAKAIFEIANAEGQVEEVEDELFRFSKILEQNGELRMALTDRSRPSEARAAMVGELLQGRVSDPSAAAATLVVGAGHAQHFGEIVRKLLELTAAEKKHAVAEVTSAVPLDEEQRRRLARALSSATGKEVDIHVVTDPSIIGGVIAKVGDQVIDGSIKGRLRQMRDQIAAVRAGDVISESSEV